MNIAKKYSSKFISFLFLVFLLILGIFLSGCTKQTQDTIGTKVSNGLIINKVIYGKEIAENSQIEITVEIKNEGFDARNVNITLIGFTDKWTPSPPITKNLDKIGNRERKNVSFIIKSPSIIANRTDKFGIKLDYNYTSKYELKIRLEKDEKEKISLAVESLRLLEEAPITIRLRDHKIVDNKEVYLNFTVSNSGTGKARDVRINAEGLTCDKDILNTGRESIFLCKLSIPQFDRMRILEFYITLFYRYEYQTNLNYEIKIYNVN